MEASPVLGASQDDFGDEKTIRAVTKIQAAWRGYCARKLFKEACSYADELIAYALSEKKTDLDPLDLSWCYPTPDENSSKSSDSKAATATSNGQQKVTVTVTAKPAVRKRSSSSSDQDIFIQPAPSTASSASPSQHQKALSASRRVNDKPTPSSQQKQSGGVVVASMKKSPPQLPPLPSQSLRSAFRSSCPPGVKSECSSPADEKPANTLVMSARGAPRAAPMSARQQRTSGRHSLNRSESCATLSRMQTASSHMPSSSTSSAATTARVQRLFNASDHTDSGRQPVTRSQRIQQSMPMPPAKWNFY